MNEDKKKKRLEYNRSIVDGVEIKCISRTNQCYKKHLHNELSIGVIEEGSTQVILGEDSYHIKTNEGVLIPPLMSHMCSPVDINFWEVIMLYIHPKYYEDVIHFNHAAKLTGKNLKIFMQFVEGLKRETDVVSLESMLIELLLQLETSTQKLEFERVRSEEKSEAVKIKDYIINHFTEEISLDLLENHFGINKFMIIRQFKKRYNTTPRAYQLQLKTAEAKSSITKGEDILDILNRIGFYDQAHFIREFKKMHGISPFAYQESIKCKRQLRK